MHNLGFALYLSRPVAAILAGACYVGLPNRIYVNILPSYLLSCCWQAACCDCPPVLYLRRVRRWAVAGAFWAYAGARGLPFSRNQPRWRGLVLIKPLRGAYLVVGSESGVPPPQVANG